MKSGISRKIAFLLTACIFCSILAFSVLFIYLLQGNLLNLKINDLNRSSTRIVEEIQTISESQKTDSQIVQSALTVLNTPYHILYTVYEQNAEKTIVATNDPFIPVLEQSEKAIEYIEEDFFVDGDLHVLYATKNTGYLVVQTAIYMDTDSLSVFLNDLPLIIALLSVPLLAFSFLAAFFFTSRVLRPVQVINKTAQEISAHNLDRRIPENGTNDELAELAKTFNSLFERLQAEFEREKVFVSDISHELRTPLAVLLGHIDLLRRWGKNDPTVAEASLETLYTEARSMQSLIENMLLLSKSEQHFEVVFEKVSLFMLLQQVIESTNLIQPDIHFELNCAEEAYIQSNKDILLQVLRIVVDNAIRYSPNKAFIALHVEQKPEVTQLIIRDRGIGISSKDLPHVFERLYRADKSRNRQTGGSGLGLAIAKSLLARIQAEIKAESPTTHDDETSGGTAMVITFSDSAIN